MQQKVRYRSTSRPTSRRRTPPAPAPADIPAAERELFENEVGRLLKPTEAKEHSKNWLGHPFFTSRIHPMFGVLLWSPKLSALRLNDVDFFRGAGRDYAIADLEWIVQIAIAELRDNRLAGHHIELALQNGIPVAAIRAIREHRYDDIAAPERDRVEYFRRVVTGQVTDKHWQKVVGRFGLRVAIELTCFATWVVMVIRTQQAFDVWYDEMAPTDSLVGATTDHEIDMFLNHVEDGTISIT